MHCALEYGSDLHVNECQRFDTIVLGLLKDKKNKKKKDAKSRVFFNFLRCVRKLHYYGDVITHLIGNQLQNTMVVFKMHDSVPSVRYSSICNVLHLWRTSLIPTYRVYRLYDYRLYDLFGTCTLFISFEPIHCVLNYTHNNVSQYYLHNKISQNYLHNHICICKQIASI